VSGPHGAGQDRSAVSVLGGVGGLSVALDDLVAGAASLANEADEVATQGMLLLAAVPGAEVVVAALAASVRRSLADGLLRPPDPSTLAAVARALARAEAAVARALGVEGAAGQAALLAGLAGSLRGAVAAYRAGERTVDALVAGAQDALMSGLGLLLPSVVVTGALTAGTAAVDPEVRARLAALLFENPWLVDVVAGGADAMVSGSGPHDPRLTALVAWACLVDGRPYPPRTPAEAVGALEALAHLGGALDEGRAVPRVRPVPPPPDAPMPTSLGSLVAGQESLGGADTEATVRVIEVPRPDGGSAWVVEIPGTQQWHPRAGPNPFDATTDVAAMAGEATVAARGVAAALDAAMRARGRAGRPDPVLLTGHSQGGIIAAALASDPGFRATHRVTHVVTCGSPVARFPVPGSVTVLSLEHLQDVVPRLDGQTNPDRAGWTTVTRDLTGDPDAAGDPIAGHAASEYVETATLVDRMPRGASASIDAWRDGATPFFAGDGHGEIVVRDYRVLRAPGAVEPGGWQNAPP
jgi:hypothetical protein